jgi:putative transcriptional regulator
MRMVRLPAALLVLACTLLAPSVAPGEGADPPRSGRNVFLDGQLLLATERMGDPRFAETVLYMVSHDAEGAFGLIVNRIIGDIPAKVLLEGLGLDTEGADGKVRLHYGGPVEPGRMWILHTSDWQGRGTVAVNGSVALTASPEIVRAIAVGRGPSRSLILLGYAGWGPRQLEGEMARASWTIAPFDAGIVFDQDYDTKWERARGLSGVPI